MTVHSNQLVTSNSVPLSYTLAYTVPSLKRTIVKSIIAWNGNAAANELDLEVRNGSTVLATFVFRQTATGSVGDTSLVSPWFVMNAGHALYVAAGKANLAIIISGSELDT